MKQIIEKIIFSSKWLLIPFYFVLYLSLVFYFLISVLWFAHHLYIPPNIEELANMGMLFIVEVMDIVMIASLAKMVITGSYNSFVSKDHHSENDNISSGLLKVKMASSLVGISSIHLLKDFVDIKDVKWEKLSELLAIHVAFIVGVVALAWIYKIYIQAEKMEHNIEFETKKHHNEIPKDSHQAL